MRKATEISKWIEEYGTRVIEALSGPSRLSDMLVALRRALRADLAESLMINERGHRRVLTSAYRPINPKYTTLDQWLADLPEKERGAVLGALLKPTVLGWPVPSPEGRTTTRPRLVIIRTRITEFSYPDHVRCVICLLFEDFESVFGRLDFVWQIGMVSSLINNWLFERDEKRTDQPSVQRIRRELDEDWVRNTEYVLKVLNIGSFVMLPLHREWLARWLIERTNQWWNTGSSNGIPDEAYTSLELDTETWMAKYNLRILNKRSESQKTSLHRASLFRILCYWAWWRGADHGWIGRFRGTKPEDLQGIENKIATGLKQLGNNEEELRKVLLRHFVESSRG